MAKNYINKMMENLNKSIGAIIGMLIVGLTILIDMLVITKTVSTDSQVLMLIIGSANTLTTTVVSYYFGSTAGSQKKDQTIKEMAGIDGVKKTE